MKQDKNTEPVCRIGPAGRRKKINILNHHINLFGKMYKRADALVNRALMPFKDSLTVGAMDLFYGFTAGDKPNLALIELSNTNPGLMFYGPKTIVSIAKHRNPDIDIDNLSTPGYDTTKVMAQAFKEKFQRERGSGTPVIGIFSGPKKVTYFEMDHKELARQLRSEGLDARVIFPESNYELKGNEFYCDCTKIDMGFIRLSSFGLMSDYFGIPITDILSLDMVWVNSPESIQLRSKKFAEYHMRNIDEPGKRINRPKTYIDSEINDENIKELFKLYGGVVTKPADGSGGKGITTYVDNEIRNRSWSKHYPSEYLLLGDGIVRLEKSDFSRMSSWIAQTSDIVSGLIKPDYFYYNGIPRIFDMRLYVVYYGGKFNIVNGLSRVASTVETNLNIITNVSRGIDTTGTVPLMIYPGAKEFDYKSEIMRAFE